MIISPAKPYWHKCVITSSVLVYVHLELSSCFFYIQLFSYQLYWKISLFFLNVRQWEGHWKIINLIFYFFQLTESKK